MPFHVATSASARDPLVLVELPARPLRSRDVRVRVRAIGVNPVDWKMREGGPLRLAQRFVGPPAPLVVGVDFAGEVVEVDARSDLRVGDRVVGGTDFSRRQYGSYADEVVVRDDQCARLPDAVSFEQAACLPVPGVTVLNAFAAAGIPERVRGARILVLGAAGGVGLMALQLAAAIGRGGGGARTVGVCSTRNVALVERQGAVAIDYTKGDALAAAKAHGPFDLVLQLVGTDAYPLRGCRALLGPKGVLCLVVIRPQDYPALIHRDVKTVLGRPVRSSLEPLVRWLEGNEIAPIVEQRFPLSEAERAHQLSRAGKVVGKLLLIP
jgi:NADPH2:quinone reductase